MYPLDAIRVLRGQVVPVEKLTDMATRILLTVSLQVVGLKHQRRIIFSEQRGSAKRSLCLHASTRPRDGKRRIGQISRLVWRDH